MVRLHWALRQKLNGDSTTELSRSLRLVNQSRAYPANFVPWLTNQGLRAWAWTWRMKVVRVVYLINYALGETSYLLHLPAPDLIRRVVYA